MVFLAFSKKARKGRSGINPWIPQIRKKYEKNVQSPTPGQKPVFPVMHPGIRIFNYVPLFSEKRSNRSLVRTGVRRGFWIRPRTLRTAERRRKSWKRTLLRPAPNSGMHQTLVQKRSETLELRENAANRICEIKTPRSAENLRFLASSKC